MSAAPSPRVIGHDAAYLLLAFPIGIVAFTVAVTGISLAAGLAITLLGIPVLLATLVACRGLADLERLRAAPILGARIPRSERRWRRDGVLSTIRAMVTDPAAWRDVLWAVALLPIGIVTFSIAIALWSSALGFLTSPLWYWALPEDDDTIPLLESTALSWSALRVLIGLVLVPVAIAACRALAEGTARLARLALG